MDEPSPVVVSQELDLQAGLAAEETLRRARHGLRAGDLGARVAAYYLADLADRRAYLDLGHPSMRHCIQHRLRTSESTAWDYVRLGRGLRTRRLVDAALAEDRISWSVAALLVGITVPDTEQAWVEWAEGRTWRQVRRQVRRRAPGDLPTAEERRRIHEVRQRVGAELSSSEYELWRRARAKLEAETGQPVCDKDILLQCAWQTLTTRPDGSIPGRTPVNDRHYLLHARPEGSSAGDTPAGAWVTTSEDAEPVALDLTELDRYPLPRATDPGDAPSDEVDPATVDPRNHGPLVPEAERDPPTGEATRKEVLLRDGHQCRCCSGLANLTVHHVTWRRYGGRTAPSNLASLCEACHSLVHARLLIVRGDPERALTFLDRRGLPLDERGPSLPASARRAELPSPASTVELRRLPDAVDAQWWSGHRHLFTRDERGGPLAFEPGLTRDPPSPAPPAPHEDRPCVGPPLREVIGQARLRERLTLAVEAARQRDEPLRHLLFTGPPGLGKTHLAEAVAAELGTSLRRLPAPLVRSPQVLVRVLLDLPPGAVLFMDELHRLPARAGEVLYEALDRGSVSLPVQQGAELRTLRVRLAAFTLLGATTDEHLLPRPLLSRLGRERLEPYTIEELSEIVARAAAATGLELTGEASRRLAGAALGTPRQALLLLQDVRDEATVRQVTTADLELVDRTLARREIDGGGLDAEQRAYLDALAAEQGPLSARTLAARLSLSEGVLVGVCEPHLLRSGLVRVTPRGRVLSGDDPTRQHGSMPPSRGDGGAT